MKGWSKVADEAEVPDGGTFRVYHDGEPVCLYNLGGTVLATHDVCTHGQASLADGFVEDGQIECPLHQGRFDIRTGRATGAPCVTDIRTYPVRVEGGGVWLPERLAITE